MLTRHEIGLLVLLPPGAPGAAISGKSNLIWTSQDIVACADGRWLQSGARTFGSQASC